MSFPVITQADYKLEKRFKHHSNELLKQIKELHKFLKEHKELSLTQKEFYCKKVRKLMKSYLKSIIQRQ